MSKETMVSVRRILGIFCLLSMSRIGFCVDQKSSGGPNRTLPIPIASPVTHEGQYAPVDVEPSTSQDAAVRISVAGESPASYDLRDAKCVTGVKNQGSSPTCWVFAAYGSLESTILVAGGPESDLSENHMKNWHGFDTGPNSGGNHYMTQAYLSRWDGPVSEADDPFHDYDDYPSPGGPLQYYVREVLMLDTAEELKTCLMTYGAVAAGMRGDTGYLDETSNTFYYDGTESPDHGITLVGWDDNKVVPNAPGLGAWLVKNSWGDEWGDNGYLWISYYDSCSVKDGWCFCDAVAPSTYRKVYYHDYYGMVGSLSTPYACNAFTATYDQVLTAVQFWTKADGASYEIRIYDEFNNGVLSGLLSSATGTCTYAGSHTVDVLPVAPLTAGDDFYIYLHITDGGSFPLACEWASDGYCASCTSSPGQCYYSLDGTNWTDLTELKDTAHFCIKGLATLSDPSVIPPEITVLGNGVSISDGDTTPDSLDGTFFESVAQGQVGTSHTFVVRNDGSGTLVLGTVVVPEGFLLTEDLPSSLASGKTASFAVRLDGSVTAADWTGDIVIPNDDSDERPFNFRISGTVLGPEIAVSGNRWGVDDGSTTPLLRDLTDFGITIRGDSPISRTFLVTNRGNATLTLGSVAVPTGFTVTEDLPTSLEADEGCSFTIQLETDVTGVKTGDVSFVNSDLDENPFNFRVTGAVVLDSGPEITVFRSVAIADGDTSPSAAKGTDFGGGVLNGDPVRRTFTVRNDGVATLTLGTVTVPAGFVLTEGLSTSLTPGARDTFTVQLNTAMLGTKTGDISFTTNDSDENPFNFRITGTMATYEVPVLFGDRMLELGLESGVLGIMDPKPSDMVTVTGLTVATSWGVENLEGIQYAKNLTWLSLWWNPIVSVAPLADLTNLTWLNAGDCSFNDLWPLAGLTNIESLCVNNDKITDIAPLAGLTSLTSLELSDNSISDASPLSGLTNLTYLNVSSNPLGDLSPLGGLENLVTLDASFNGEISDLSPVAGMTSLESLYLGWNQVADLSPLAGLVSLAHLELVGNCVGDISPLCELPQLTYLGLAMNPTDDFSPLADMANVTHLGLSTTSIRDLSPLAGLTQLVNLSLGGNWIDDIGPLAGLVNLTELDLMGNLVSDLSPVVGMTKLTYLQIASNQICDISVLSGLSYLTELDARSNYISDLSPLCALTNLTYLGLTDNPLNDKAYTVYIPLIQANNPGIEVTYDPLPVLSLSDITVLGNGISITDGDSTPSTADGTNFGTVIRYGEPINQTFTIYNNGTAVLTFFSIGVPNGFDILEDLHDLEPGESCALKIQLKTTVPGVKSGDISLRTNDQDESFFNFRVTGKVLDGSPELTMLGRGIAISNGSATTSTDNGTAWGIVLQGSSGASHTFAIRNDGTAGLIIDSVNSTAPTGFSGGPNVSRLDPGESGILTLELDTSVLGTRTGDYCLVTNDDDESCFRFRVTGTVVASGNPEIVVLGNGIEIRDGDGSPDTTDGTYFGALSPGDPAVSHTFAVRNDGAVNLRIYPQNMQIPSGFTLVSDMPTSVAPGESETFTVQMNTTTTGLLTGFLSFENNDSDESPFNFRITGTVGGPDITVLGNGISIADGDSTPCTADGTDWGTVKWSSNPSRTYTVRNDGDATLEINTMNVTMPTGFQLTEGFASRTLPAGQSDTITVGLSGVTRGKPGTYAGDISLVNDDPDENPFNFRITVTLTD